MAIELNKQHLQTEKYDYTWNRAKGDGESIGKLDQMKVHKKEGYEVLLFVQELMNKHNLMDVSDVHRIEDVLHSSKLSSVVMRKDLEEKIELKLSL